MKTNRRSFLTLLGVGTATAPLAVKAAADAEIASLTRVGKEALSSSGMGLYGGGIQAAGGEQSAGIPYAQKYIQATDYIKMFGVPEFVEAELRDQSKWISALDPDIACKKSWSMSVKILEQRSRNYERLVKRMHMTAWTHKKRSAIKSILGFEWPF